MKNNYIKFTFNIDDAFNRISKKNFSEPLTKLCQINYERVINQKVIYDNLPKEYLNTETSKGFCTLVAIYNAFNDVFGDIDELISFIESQLDNNKSFSSLELMTKEINKYKKEKLLFTKQNLKDSYTIMVKNINIDKPVVASYHLNSYLPIYSAHTITIVGYDEYYLYYIENSESDYMFQSLAHYILSYYKRNPIPTENTYYIKLTEATNEVNEPKLWSLMKDILGYSIDDKVTRIRKDFLTNGKYFFDLNRLITHPKKLETYWNYSNTNTCNFSLSSLTDRLQKLNY